MDDDDNNEDLTDLEIERSIEFRKRINDIIKSPVEKDDEDIFTEQLLRVLRYEKFDVDAAVVTLKKGLTFGLIDEMGKIPFQEYKRVYDDQIFLILKKTAPDGSKIIWVRIRKWNANEIGIIAYLAATFHYADEALYSCKTQKHGLSYIVDYSGVGIVTLGKLLSLMTKDINRQLAAMYQGAYPVKLKAFHIINCPWLITVFYSGIKYLLSKKIRQRCHLHYKGSEILCKYFDQDALPVGLSGSIADENAVDVELLKSVYKKGISGGSSFSKYRRYFVIPK